MALETNFAQQPLDSKEYVSRLRDDVLSQIFLLNTEFDFDTPHIPSRTIRYISQVSTRWRNITLSSPMLWASSLDFADKIEWIQTVLDRAKDSPLNVVYPSFSSQLLSNQTTLSQWRHLEHEYLLTLVQKTWHGAIDIKKLNLALSLFSRSQRFRLMLYNDDEWKYAREKPISLAAPHLEELVVVVTALNSRRPHNGRKSTIFDVGISCAQNLELKTLHLSGYGLKPLAFESATLLNLTTLVIKGLEVDKSLKVDQCLAILSSSPHLEVLHLDDCFGDWRSFENLQLTPGQPISLPRLRSLKLQGFYVGVSTIFCRIEVPPTCAMDVRFQGAEDPVNTPLVTTTLSLIQQRLQNFIALQPIVDMSLFLKRYPGLGWKFYNNIHSADETPFCVAWRSYEMPDSMPFFLPLKKILDVISPNLKSLYFDTAKIRQNEAPYQVGILEALRHVELLGIQSGYTVQFIEMKFNDNLAASSNKPLLPSLQLILFSHLYIRNKEKTRICNIFAARLKLGTPIAKCRVKLCSGPALQELIKDLRGLGVDVECDPWDEKTEDKEEEELEEWDHDAPGPGDDDSDEAWKNEDEGDFEIHKPVARLGPLAIQSTRDGTYKDDSDDMYDSEDMFDSGEDEDSD